MKKIILFSVIILIMLSVALGIGYYFLKDRSRTSDYNPPVFVGEISFDYDDGEEPWVTPAKTGINTAYSMIPFNGYEVPTYYQTESKIPSPRTPFLFALLLTDGAFFSDGASI